MKLRSLALSLALSVTPYLALAQSNPAGQQQAAPTPTPMITEDWLQVDDAKFKVFLPGGWNYEASSDSIGVKVVLKSGNHKILFTLQSIEGKTEATPEKLRDIFEADIVTGAKREELPSKQGLRTRYVADISGQTTVCYGLFLRQPSGTAYMIYAQALTEEVKADASLEKTMVALLDSFTPITP